MSLEQPIIFSGVQPSGRLTLGNYLGAIKNWVQLQADYQCLFSIVDLHAITVRQNPAYFKAQCYDILATYLAAGLDIKAHHIFLQSHVAAHTQLAWLLGCYTYVGELSRMTQFKDKSKKNEANLNVGLFTYPILMAADILLYQSELVPVGSDQKQHLELARDLAIRFNNLYAPVFKVPKIYQPKVGARVMSLAEPSKKMSKSDENPNAAIFLSDSLDELAGKIKRAVTDSESNIAFDVAQKPGVSNLLTILASITNRSIEEWVAELAGCGYGKLKELVIEALSAFLIPMQSKYQAIRQDQTYLEAILASGAEYAAQKAQPTLEQAYRALGFVRYEGKCRL